MKAFVLTGFDRAPEFADIAEPQPGPGEIRVRVHATSVNPVDHMIRSGFFRAVQEYRFPAIFGRDLAGMVDAAGDGVTRFREGDEVYGFVKRDYIGDGTFAEYVVVPADFFVAADQWRRARADGSHRIHQRPLHPVAGQPRPPECPRR